jgi:hypothetical protein
MLHEFYKQGLGTMLVFTLKISVLLSRSTYSSHNSQPMAQYLIGEMCNFNLK